MKIQRMFSTVEEEKLYSTGNNELDELLERAFCEGYEYAQKEFASARQRKKNVKNAAKIEAAALGGEISVDQANKELGRIKSRQGTGKVLNIKDPVKDSGELRTVRVKAQKSNRQARHIAEGLGNGNIEETKILTQKLDKTRKGDLNAVAGAGRGINLESHVSDGGFNPKQAKVNRMTQEGATRRAQKAARAERQKKITEERKQLRNQQKQEAQARQQKAVEERSKKLELGKQKQQEQIKNAREYQASKPKPTKSIPSTPTPKPNSALTPIPTKSTSLTPTPKPKPKQKEAAEGFIKRNWNKLGKGGKIAAVAIPTVAAVGTGIAINRNKKTQET